jgi:hypothetical protein
MFSVALLVCIVQTHHLLLNITVVENKSLPHVWFCVLLLNHSNKRFLE